MSAIDGFINLARASNKPDAPQTLELSEYPQLQFWQNACM